MQTLIVWENLSVTRYELKSNIPEKSNPVLYLRPEQEADKKLFVDEVWGLLLDVRHRYFHTRMCTVFHLFRKGRTWKC